MDRDVVAVEPGTGSVLARLLKCHGEQPDHFVGARPGGGAETMGSMFWSIASFYLFMKIAYFFSLVRILVKFEPMQKHVLFLGMIYTAGVGFLFTTLMLSWSKFVWPAWQVQISQSIGLGPFWCWLGEMLGLSTLYFWLLTRYDEGVVFWTLILAGVLFVYFI